MNLDDGRPLILLGAGGHARVLVSILRRAGIVPAGCTALERPGAQWPDDIPYLGSIDALGQRDPRSVRLVNGVGSAGAAKRRRDVFENAAALGFEFAGVRHPAAIIDDTSAVDRTAQVIAGAIIQNGAVIGANALINTGAIVDHDSRVGAHSHVATGARLAGEVIVGEAVHIGAGATIIQRVRIGDGAVIAAGAAVVGDVPAGTTYGGVPARPLRKRETLSDV